MKTCKYLGVLLCLIFIVRCDTEEKDILTVQRYVSLLKSNQFDASMLPEFGLDAIPVLLNYRNEGQFITNFPVNPISSYAHPKCKLGMFVLWTIESIRVAAHSNFTMGFPSQNAILECRQTGEIVPPDDSRSHEIAANAYHEWWKKNKFKDQGALNAIDPLVNTAYRWH